MVSPRFIRFTTKILGTSEVQNFKVKIMARISQRDMIPIIMHVQNNQIDCPVKINSIQKASNVSVQNLARIECVAIPFLNRINEAR